jgi:hypothetical protein
MKLKSILGIAAVSALALSSGANAAWFGHGNNANDTGGHHSFFGSLFHGKNTSTYMWNGYEVSTPSQVNESAPWMANQPHMPGAVAVQISGARISNMVGAVSDTTGAPYATGVSSSVNGYGTTGFDSNGYGMTTYDSNGYGNNSFHSNGYYTGRYHPTARMNSYDNTTTAFDRSGRPYWGLDS